MDEANHAVKITLDELENIARKNSENPYDLANNTCHDTRETILGALGVQSPPPRMFTRITNYLRPPVSALNVRSHQASASSPSR